MKWSLILLSLLISCSSPSPYNYEYIADQVTNKTIDELKKKGLFAIGTGGGMMGDIYKMSITFNYYHPIDLQESRKLLIYAIQTYLKNINGNKEIRPYLHNYPFTVKDIQIIIFIYTENGKNLLPEKIEIIESSKNKLIYSLSRERKFEPWPILKEETYEEALKILEGTQ